ncbi:MAG: hypothetical protein WCP69_10860 [Bacteroidota bacterium]
MKTKNIIFIAIITLFSSNLFAQNEIEALRYSQMFWGNTARSAGVGGAFGAVGADFSSLSINPAGMGVYKKSELSFSPSLYYSKNVNTYNGVESEDYKYNFNIGNFGMVFNAPLSTIASDKPQWKSVQFGFGMNRLANYNNHIAIEGNNNSSTIMDVFASKAYGLNPVDLDPYDTYMAWDAHLLNRDTDTNIFTNPIHGGDITQRKTIDTKGSMNEWAFSLSGNYNDKLFLGATIGLVGFNYQEDSQYEEIDRLDTIVGFHNFTINDNLSTHGNGVNFKFGFLAQPVKFIRIGAAIHTPTFFYSIEDTYKRNIISDMESVGRYDIKSEELKYKYELNTPLRLMGNIAFLINKLGFISFDYEYADYSTSRMRASDYNFYNENSTVKNGYTATHNFRGGAEFNLKPVLLRAGYAYYSSPFKSATTNDASKSIISGGIGFRNQQYFADFTYAYSYSNDKYYLYDTTPLNPSMQKTTSSNFIVSMGVKF